MVLAAVQQDGDALQHASKPLQEALANVAHPASLNGGALEAACKRAFAAANAAANATDTSAASGLPPPRNLKRKNEDASDPVRIKQEAQEASTRLQGRASRLAPLDVWLLCSPATDLEKHHEVIVVNQELSKLRPLSFYDDPQARRYQAVPLMSVAQARSRHSQYLEELYPMPAVVHLICHANKSAMFELDEDVHFEEVVRAGVTSGTHVLLNCCNGWQCKGSQIVKIAPGSGMCPPKSLLAWRIQPENDMCIALTKVYYELLAQPGGHAASLAARVVAHPRVLALTVDGRPLRVASLHGAESPHHDTDLVAWQPSAS